MASRYRVPSTSKNADLASVKLATPPKSRYRYVEFKYLYFQIQRLINKNVVLSLKYEQLKSPEIRMSVIRPLVLSIVALSNASNLAAQFSSHFPNYGEAFDTPRFAPLAYGLVAPENTDHHVSTNVIYVLLLLRYEYMIQWENNLVMYDLLTTKANICELIAIRMLREYRSHDRINLLFLNPMRHHYEENKLLKHTKHLDCFNTLELSILSKLKRFLAQPVVVQILERIYNGELIIKDHQVPASDENGWVNLLNHDDVAPDYETGTSTNTSSQDLPDLASDSEKSVVNYKFNRITMGKVIVRAHVVPKYQSLVINIKYGLLAALFFVLVIRHKHKTGDMEGNWFGRVLSVLFWMLALSFNFDNILKLMHIEFKFLKKIVWTFFDLVIVVLIDISFVLRILMGLDKISSTTYYSVFSLISVLLFPRMLSVFNNYEFFNMMIVSFKKMSWNMIAMVCLFLSLIFGFFLCFISLTIDLSTSEVAYTMLQLFFGFTPAVWDHWNSYSNLGRGIQISYLFLIQFIVATILAIVLSNVFAKVSETNKEEFEYLKTTNLIIYLKWGNLHWTSHTNRFGVVAAFNSIVNVFKLPIIVMIYFYELLIKDNKRFMQKQQRDLKNFTFLSKEDDFYGDHNLMSLAHADDSDVSTILMKSRRGSQFGTLPIRRVSPLDANAPFASEASETKPKLMPQKSVNTFTGIRSGLVDSMFIDEYFGRKYGLGRTRTNVSELKKRKVSKSQRRKVQNAEVMRKLEDLEHILQLLVEEKTDAGDNFEVKQFVDIYEMPEDRSEDLESTGDMSDFSRNLF